MKTVQMIGNTKIDYNELLIFDGPMVVLHSRKKKNDGKIVTSFTLQ